MTASTQLPPKGIERKRAHIVGGGIAGFATAAFLIDDAHMPGENITIYEAEKVHGGCLDAHRLREGYKNRGSRMWERRYECTYFLLEKIPSIDNSGPDGPRRDVPGERGPSLPCAHALDAQAGREVFANWTLDVQGGRPETDEAAP